jgi:hypothetical protein
MTRNLVRIVAPISLASAATSPSLASITWDDVARFAVADIAPGLASQSASTHQVLGMWSESVYCAGPWVPDPIFQQAHALAMHTSNIGMGAVPWAIMTGRVAGNRAVPSATTYGSGIGTIRLDATFTTTETVGFEARNVIGSFQPEATIYARLICGSETIFFRSGPDAFTSTGTLAPGTYTLTLLASYANGDPGSSGISCDLRFTLPSPATGALGAACALLRRRRRP